MNEASQGTCSRFGFEERLLEELRLLASSGSPLPRSVSPKSAAIGGRPRFNRRLALALLAVALMLAIAATAVAGGLGSLLGHADSEKLKTANLIRSGGHIGSEVASAGSWKLYAAASDHEGLTALQISQLEGGGNGMAAATAFDPDDPLFWSAIYPPEGVIYGHANPDRVALLELRMGDETRRLPMGRLGYFLEPLDPHEAAAIDGSKASLVALGPNGAVVKAVRIGDK
jgi:hypothetical protein